ncbi:MAG: hypothetical protein ACK5LJ_07240 [Paracoccus sp. (in: a-proteobacteria)]
MYYDTPHEPVEGSSAFASTWAAEEAEREARAEFLYGEFMKSALRGDANALCDWAPMVTDWALVPRPLGDTSTAPKRVQALWEVFEGEVSGQPVTSELIQLLLNAANGAEVKHQARELVKRIGSAFSESQT